MAETVVDIGVADCRIPATNFGLLQTRVGSNMTDEHLAFGDGTTNTVTAPFTVPQNYAGGGLTFAVKGRATTATSGEARVGLSFVKEGDIDTVNFGTQTADDITATGAAGTPFTHDIAISHANLGSPAKGDRIIAEIEREGGHANDDMSGNYEFLTLHGREI